MYSKCLMIKEMEKHRIDKKSAEIASIVMIPLVVLACVIWLIVSSNK